MGKSPAARNLIIVEYEDGRVAYFSVASSALKDGEHLVPILIRAGQERADIPQGRVKRWRVAR